MSPSARRDSCPLVLFFFSRDFRGDSSQISVPPSDEKRRGLYRLASCKVFHAGIALIRRPVDAPIARLNQMAVGFPLVLGKLAKRTRFDPIRSFDSSSDVFPPISFDALARTQSRNCSESSTRTWLMQGQTASFQRRESARRRVSSTFYGAGVQTPKSDKSEFLGEVFVRSLIARAVANGINK